MEGPSPEEVRRRLLAWFDAGHRDMPWRRTKDPYRVLLAEYLLQRTRVASGTPYYERFLARFPDIASLAAAPESDVLRAWEGLGYYRRARNLRAAAQIIVRDHGGRIPSDAATLATLPGIGPYTAGAVASIAFGEPVPAVDGNATRVLSRLFRVDADVTTAAGRARIAGIASDLVDPHRPGDFNPALMDLGSTVCTPLRPSCEVCPLEDVCLARDAGVETRLPRTPPRRRAETAQVAFAYVRARGRTLLVRRPDSELLGGLWSFPGGEIGTCRSRAAALRRLVASQTGVPVEVHEAVAPIAHTFSHRRWSGAVFRCVPRGPANHEAAARWVSDTESARLPLVPSHRKLLEGWRTRPPLEAFARTRRRGP